jgi:thymidylate synthase
LEVHPDTRQAIINIHSNICPTFGVKGAAISPVFGSADLENTGGLGRIPCSMYYQFIRRNNALNLIYTMRSCDFLVHYPIDLMLALRAQTHVAQILGIKPGAFTHFIGSLHAYQKDMSKRGIF